MVKRNALGAIWIAARDEANLAEAIDLMRCFAELRI